MTAQRKIESHATNPRAIDIPSDEDWGFTTACICTPTSETQLAVAHFCHWSRSHLSGYDSRLSLPGSRPADAVVSRAPATCSCSRSVLRLAGKLWSKNIVLPNKLGRDAQNGLSCSRWAPLFFQVTRSFFMQIRQLTDIDRAILRHLLSNVRRQVGLLLIWWNFCDMFQTS